MTGLIAKPNFEDIAARLDSPFQIKKPDRLAKFILESPALASFDETGDLEAEEQRRAIAQTREAEIKRVAQESGAPASLLRALEHRPTPFRIDNRETDAHQARAIQLQLEDATQTVEHALATHENVQRMVGEISRNVDASHRQNAIHDIEYFDIFDDNESLPEPDPRTVEEQRGIIRLTDEDQALIDREFQYAQPGFVDAMQAAGNFMQGLGNVAQGMGSVAQFAGGLAQETLGPGTREVMRALPIAARGGAAITSTAARGLGSAMQTLIALGMPMNRRAEIFRPGINIADGFGNFVATHRI